MNEEDFEKFSYVAGKRLDIFLKQTARRAANEAKLASPKDDAEDIYSELLLWAISSRPDLIDRATIRMHHQANAIHDPWYTVDDWEVNYSAAKVFALEANKVARALKSGELETRRFKTEDQIQSLWTGKAVGNALKDWDNLPEVVVEALASDRLSEAYRDALTRHYRDGQRASAVGRNNLQRGRDKLVEILNSGNAPGEHADPEDHAAYGWGPQLRPAGFRQRRYPDQEQSDYLAGVYANGNRSESLSAALESLEVYEDTPGDSEWLSGALSGFRGSATANSTDDEITADVLAARPMREAKPKSRMEWLAKRYDIELDLYIWGITGRFTNPMLEEKMGELTEEEREALRVRYCPEVDPKVKREGFDDSIKALKKIRDLMGVQAGTGAVK
ncbi:hypothetical protein [Micromonospora sp. NPDC049891]|uniref:hypothetical protein n=1 Tax=Micromonospora sp. NPDC049891 TaxID=3155655 RepID=UPI0033D28DE7